MRIYIDSAPLIYLVEDVAPHASVLESRLSAPDITQVCSELSSRLIDMAFWWIGKPREEASS